MSKGSKKSKKKTILVRLVSELSSGKAKSFVLKKRQDRPKIELNKYDSVLRKHVKFVEKKMKK